jgi:hypothetical protein
MTHLPFERWGAVIHVAKRNSDVILYLLHWKAQAKASKPVAHFIMGHSCDVLLSAAAAVRTHLQVVCCCCVVVPVYELRFKGRVLERERDGCLAEGLIYICTHLLLLLLAAAVPLLSQLLFHAKNMSKVELPGFF